MRTGECQRSAVWAAVAMGMLCPGVAAVAWAEEPVAKLESPTFDSTVRPLLERHCFACHSGEQPKGDFSLADLPPAFADAAHRKQWLAVVERIESGEMPPQEKPRPPADDVALLTDWIGSRAREAEEAARKSQGRVVLRRLNRIEYENTIRDLLGIHVDLQELLPPDSSDGGFDNVGSALHTSSFLLDKYLEAAEKSLNLAIANLPQPPLVKKRYTLKEERLVKTTTESVYRQEGDTVVMFSSSAWNAITVGQFYPPDRGQYRIRISARGYQSGGKPVTYRVDAGPMLMGTKNHLVSYFDAAADQPTVAEFLDHFEARNHIRIHPYGLANAQTVNKIGADKYEGAGLAVEWIEVEGPLHESWPPESHRRIFGDLLQGPAPIHNYRNRVEVISSDPPADAQRVLERFARRAFRRPVSPDDLKPLIALVEAKLAGGESFERAVRAGLKGVLMSPSFLFLQEKPGKLDDFALASRLSYFLWSTMPDDDLLLLAERNELSQPAVLRAQVERLLNHSKAAAFTKNFVGQWLRLREIDATEPSHILYPEFDDMLKESMIRESELFFAEILKDDLSVANFVASDFAMLNGRLARHYGIPDIDGWEFRKTMLPADSHRGGVLTMASVLKVTANGTTTSPVMRGVWVLDRVLGTPPSPPPADVPAVEPDIRGATTIREQLAKHREVDSCAACHREIDPPGFALENYDVIGGWREHYRTTGSGDVVIVDGRRVPYHQGKPIDPADTLPDGRKFQNIDELKQLLLTDQDKVARALATRLATYATGAVPSAADADAVDAIVANVRQQNYGLRSLVHAITQSEMFQTK